MQAVGQNMDAGVPPIDPFTIEPDQTVAVVEGSSCHCNILSSVRFSQERCCVYYQSRAYKSITLTYFYGAFDRIFRRPR